MVQYYFRNYYTKYLETIMIIRFIGWREYVAAVDFEIKLHRGT